MLKIEGLDSLQKQVGLAINAVSQAASNLIPKLAQSPELPVLLGECYQRGIDNNQTRLKPVSPKYAEFKSIRFKSKKILVATGSLYRRAILPNFFAIQPTSSTRLEVKFSDSVAKGQAQAGRNPLIADDQLNTGVTSLANQILATQLSKNINT